jgi:hypothetical protein
LIAHLRPPLHQPSPLPSTAFPPLYKAAMPRLFASQHFVSSNSASPCLHVLYNKLHRRHFFLSAAGLSLPSHHPREALGEAPHHPLSLFPLSRRVSAPFNGRACSLRRERRLPWPPVHGGPVDRSRRRSPRDHELGSWIFILKKKQFQFLLYRRNLHRSPCSLRKF